MVRKHTIWHTLAFIGLALILGACSGAMAAELPEELPESVELEIEDGRQELEFTGTLEAQAGDEWTVSGVTFAVTPETEVHGEIGIGDSVKVHAFLGADGNLTAREIEPIDARDEDEADEGEIEFTGTLESQDGGSWTIDGTVVLIVPGTEVKGDLSVGDLVKVHANWDSDGNLVAREIEPAEAEEFDDDEGEFEFTGTVQSIGPVAWTIGGRTVAVTPATEIEPGIAVGDLVKVHASMSEGGRLTAREIDPAELDDDDEMEADGEREVEFVGVIESVSGASLVVNGVTVQITDATELEADLTVGNTVEVEAFSNADGVLIAEEIEDADEDDQDGPDLDDEDEDGDDHEADDHDDDDDEDDKHEQEDDEDRSGSNSGSG